MEMVQVTPLRRTLASCL